MFVSIYLIYVFFPSVYYNFVLFVMLCYMYHFILHNIVNKDTIHNTILKHAWETRLSLSGSVDSFNKLKKKDS